MTKQPPTAYLSLGSNVGDRVENLRRAMLLLCDEEMALRRTSSIYETEPVENTKQDWFLNCVAEISTRLAPVALLRRLQQIESQLGRQRSIPKGPRPIDIDMLLYGAVVMQSDELTLPHPRLLERRFVLEPLCEIAPSLRLPGSGTTVREALRRLSDPAAVRLFLKTLCA
ncbi:MAG TPA: 2-amino-4-hydroxy-6-hydroxymethyldihydropteridine diphosphokinase [Terriglobia bacterium]|nr:2-amino-4-hydroxy-6-hydroxymethyldihydropteridine diphosphokinase [Terriglobia bacterium]